MKRQARPLGLTLLTQSIHTKQALDDKTIGQLINYSLNHTLSYNNKPFSTDTLAYMLGISPAEAYKHYIKHTARVANLINPKDIQGLYLGQIFGLLAGASGTLRDIGTQKRILQAAQGNDYVPFLTEQVNSILGTEMAAYEKMAKIAQALTTGVDPRAMPQPADQAPGNEKAIGVNEAMRLLESKGQLGLNYGEENNKHLPITKELLQLPEVRANKQQGNTDDANLAKMGKAHHRNRRAKELDLDEESL